MIQKYKEFIREAKVIGGDENYRFPIKKEELEDHLLRLEEVFHCYCSIDADYGSNQAFIHIFTPFYYIIYAPHSKQHHEAELFTYGWVESDFEQYRSNVSNEINEVVARLNNIYPDILFEKTIGIISSLVDNVNSYRIECDIKRTHKSNYLSI